MAAVVTAKTDTDAQACAMRRHFDLGNRGEAAALCQTLLSADPSFAEPYLVAGLMAKANGAIDKAEAFLRRALDLGCRDPLGLVALADMRRARGDLEAALAGYRDCLAAHPNHAAALISMARTLRDLGQAVAARDMLSRALLAGDEQYDATEHTNLWLELAGLQLGEDAIAAALRAHAIAHDRRPPARGDVAVFGNGGDLAAWCRARGHRVDEVPALTLRRLDNDADARPARLCYLPAARVIGDTSIPASAEGMFFADGLIPSASKMAVADVSLYYHGLIAADGERILALAKTSVRHAGDHLFLGFHENFGHWMVNVLSRLLFLRHKPELRGLPLVVGGAIGASTASAWPRSATARMI